MDEIPTGSYVKSRLGNRYFRSIRLHGRRLQVSAVAAGEQTTAFTSHGSKYPQKLCQTQLEGHYQPIDRPQISITRLLGLLHALHQKTANISQFLGK